jgi:hypothetical protein
MVFDLIDRYRFEGPNTNMSVMVVRPILAVAAVPAAPV